MTSILFLIDTIQLNQFICIYLRNKKGFLEFFFCIFQIYINIEHFQKKVTLIADVFLNYGLQKMGLNNCLKSPVSEDPLTSNMENGPKHC